MLRKMDFVQAAKNCCVKRAYDPAGEEGEGGRALPHSME